MGLEVLMGNPYVWLIVAVVAAVIEAVSVSLITVWFVVGAVVSFFIAFFGGPAWVQLAAFLVVSLLCLLLLRPVIMKNRKRGEAHEATDRSERAWRRRARRRTRYRLGTGRLHLSEQRL